MKLHLKEWRLQRFLTVRALAEKASVAYTTIVRLEGGQHQPNMTTIHKLAKALGIKPGQLVEWGVAAPSVPGKPTPNSG